MRLSGTKLSSIHQYQGLGNQLWDLAGSRPSLDLRFADNKSLVDATTGQNLVSFSRASSATYVGSDGLIKTATTNAPRFDHDPETGESLGLLVEEERTNLLLYSTNFDNSYWVQTHITTNAVTGPDGMTTAATYEGIGGGGLSVYNVTSAAVSASTQYTFSVYIKLGTMSANDYKFAVYDVSNSSFVGLDLVPAVTPTTTSWTRVIHSFTTPAGCTELRVYPFRNSATIPSSTVHLWGAQLEAGSFPTSYIPTEGTTVTRAADVASITGTNFSSWYNQSEGTVFADVKSAPVDNIAQVTVDITNGTTAERILQRRNTSGIIGFAVVDGGVTQGDIGTSTIDPSARYRSGAAYKLNDLEIVVNGAGSPTDTSATLPTPNQIHIGQNFASGQICNGHIRRLTYWPRRLDNNTLQSITL